MAKRDHTPNPELERLLGPTAYEVGCDECTELRGQYVELEIEGADADERIPGLRNHLDGCPACREEHDSLLALVTAERRAGRSARTAAQRPASANEASSQASSYSALAGARGNRGDEIRQLVLGQRRLDQCEEDKFSWRMCAWSRPPSSCSSSGGDAGSAARGCAAAKVDMVDEHANDAFVVERPAASEGRQQDSSSIPKCSRPS
jgi:hypothetical protein